MPELYYAMCFDGDDGKQSNFYHCIALAESEEHFKAIVSDQKNLLLQKSPPLLITLKRAAISKKSSI